ncbi:MAG TPA: hypothetical protein VFQ67_08905 [Allosphingosinicella sp.]|jgi:hypothetical protein|nr:hypothetical protein [Allosphingosinicella sp.]
MSGIDRRTLLGAAGAGLVLAGCTSKSGKKHRMDMVGTCQLHGQSVRDKMPYVLGDTKSFAPDRLCIVYLKFASGRMKVRRTYLDINASTNLQAVIHAELQRISPWGAPDSVKDRDDLHPIKLSGQRIVAIYLDNDRNDIRFSYKRGSTLAQEEESYAHTIRFTQFSGEDPDAVTRKNHAFFNVRKMLLSGVTAPMRSPEVFLLDYWNTNEIGNKIEVVSGDPDTEYLYSMNIKLEMAAPMPASSTSPQRWIPIILDPDTGNMGAEP